MKAILLGAGGHAAVVADSFDRRAYDEVFALVPGPSGAAPVFDIRVKGKQELVFDYDPAHVVLVNCVGGTSSTERRRAVFESFKARGYRFLTVVHPSAVVSRYASIAEGAQILAGAVLQAGATVGVNSIVNTRASVDHDCHIGAHVHIAPGAVLSGGVRVGDGSHLGTGAIVIQGVSIGENAMVAAGAVVVRDVPAGARVAGVPAKGMSQ